MCCVIRLLTCLLQSLDNSPARFMLEHKMLRNLPNPQKVCVCFHFDFCGDKLNPDQFFHQLCDHQAHLLALSHCAPDARAVEVPPLEFLERDTSIHTLVSSGEKSDS